MKTPFLLLSLAVLIHSVSVAQQKTYLLVHGAWHGAWCWKKVVPLLEAGGNRALAIDLPGHGEDKTPVAMVTLDDYVRTVVAAANAQAGPVILVGHSMAGVVIAQAAESLGKGKVAKLVFLDAFMPQNGESVFALAEKIGSSNQAATPLASVPSVQESMLLSEDQKTCRLKPENTQALFYHDCSPEDIAFAKAHLGSEPMAALATPVRVTDARYGAIPKTYIVCSQAKDMDKSSLVQHVPCQKVYTLASSHSPFFSMPDKLADILLEQ